MGICVDIVQYLHGLVSQPLGISSEDASADLLKQYYALSVVHIVENSIDVKDKKNHSILNVWASQTLPLTKRLARSFHMDEMQTLTLLRTVTPLMLTELNGVAGNVGLAEFVAQHFHRSRTHLPAWSSQFIKAEFVHLNEEVSTPTNNANTTNTMPTLIPSTTTEPTGSDSTEDIPTLTDEVQTPPPRPNRRTKPKYQAKSNTLAWVAGGAVLGLAVIGVGVWYALSGSQTEQATDPNVATLSVQNLNIPRLSITSGENHQLYACQAEVGSDTLHRELMQILQKNFGQASCIVDIDNKFGSSLVGLERLESIIAMLKSEPFSSIEIVGNEIFVNTPNTQVLTRLVEDIALLAPQFSVSAVPALDVPTLTNASLDKASNALNALETPSAYDLARAMSLQVLDFNGSDQIPAQNQAVLTLSAKKLAQNPDIKLLIVSHTDNNGMDRATNLSLSQAQAEAVRAFLIQNGANEAQLVAKGVADAFPIADNITTVGKFKNRRTEFLVYDEAVLASLSSADVPAMPDAMGDMAMNGMEVGDMAMNGGVGGMPVNVPQNTPRVGGYAQPLPTPAYNANANLNYANPNANYASPNQVITPMPVQGMPNAQTYSASNPDYYQPPVEVVYGGQPMLDSESSIRITPANPQSDEHVVRTQSSQPTQAQPAVPVISDEVMELSKPVHVEIGKGISHEIIKTD